MYSNMYNYTVRRHAHSCNALELDNNIAMIDQISARR